MTQPPFLSAAEIKACVTVRDLIAPLTHVMISVSGQAVLHPPRFAIPINDAGRMGLMYGALRDPPVHGAKILSLYPAAPAQGLSSHQGFVLLFDSRDGRPLAIFDAESLTAIRTAAVSMLATQTLARPNPKCLLVCGAGEQARWHLAASLSCFEGAEIRLWSRRPEQADALLAAHPDAQGRMRTMRHLSEAIAGADVIHTVTSARQAFLPGALLEPGQHINLVGASLADSREIDDEGVARLRMFTDSTDSSSREAGEILGAKKTGKISDDFMITEIGQVLKDPRLGRVDARDITAYKSHGLIAQDLVTAYIILKKRVSSA